MTDDLLSRRPRTRLVLSEADMARLRDLYYDRDVSMTRVAAAFGLSTSTLYHGIAEMDWPRRSATFPIRTQPHRAAVEVGAAPHPVGSAEPEAPFDPQRRGRGAEESSPRSATCQDR
jgi:transposase-like protein